MRVEPHELTDAEIAKAKACLSILENAQDFVYRAARELCAVRGFAEEWNKLDQPAAAIKAHWYAISDRLRTIRDSADGVNAKRPEG